MGGRIVLTMFGSLGDLHPYLAIGQELRARGHAVTVATSEYYRRKVEGDGLAFASLRPDIDLHDVEMLRRLTDLRHGTEFVVRGVAAVIRETYADLWAATEGADLLVTHGLSMAGPIIARQRPQMRWASSVLAPIGFASAYDPPVPPPAPWLRHVYGAGPLLWRPLYGLGRWSTRHWADPVRELAAEHGIELRHNPLFEGQHSPELVLALFSPLFGPKQPDFPAPTVVTGFPFYAGRQNTDAAIMARVREFVQAEEAPVLFTLGSSAVVVARDFFTESVKAARLMGRRAILLVGADPGRQSQFADAPDVLAVPYVPHELVMPLAAAIVHPGGIGTTAQALRAGKPMLVVPFANDQPDNAARCERLGVGAFLLRSDYRAGRTARSLQRLLGGPALQRAVEVGQEVAAERGVATACDALEQLLNAGGAQP